MAMPETTLLGLGFIFWCYSMPQHTAEIGTKFKAIRMGQIRRREITTFEKAMFVSTSTPQNIQATHHDTALLSVSTQESRNRSLLHSICVLCDLPSLAVTCLSQIFRLSASSNSCKAQTSARKALRPPPLIS